MSRNTDCCFIIHSCQFSMMLTEHPHPPHLCYPFSQSEVVMTWIHIYTSTFKFHSIARGTERAFHYGCSCYKVNCDNYSTLTLILSSSSCTTCLLNHNDLNREISIFIYMLSWKCCCFCQDCSCQLESRVTEHIFLHVGQKQISIDYIISKQCLLLDQPPRPVRLYQEALLHKLTTESSGGETDKGMWPLYFPWSN